VSRLTRRRLLAGGGAARGAGAVGLATVAHPRQLWHRLSGACGSEPPRLSLRRHDYMAGSNVAFVGEGLA
jgi:hypothetical protein